VADAATAWAQARVVPTPSLLEFVCKVVAAL